MSIGTSLPELVTSVVAARKNEVDMAVSYTHLDVYKRQAVTFFFIYMNDFSDHESILLIPTTFSSLPLA